jgi:hypothetical protein
MPQTSMPRLKKPLQHASAGAFYYHHFPSDVKKIAHIRTLLEGSYSASPWFNLLLINNHTMAHHVLYPMAAKAI